MLTTDKRSNIEVDIEKKSTIIKIPFIFLLKKANNLNNANIVFF